MSFSFLAPSLAALAWEWIVSSRIYGLAGGCLLSAVLSNHSSRKTPLIASMILSLLGAALTLLITHSSSHWGILLGCGGRFLGGVGSGIAQVVGSAMLAEIPPLHSRGRVLATLTVWSCIGELTGMVISLEGAMGRSASWNWALVAPTAILPLAMAFILSAPDSPRALLMAGSDEEAVEALRLVRLFDSKTIGSFSTKS